jgi:hypothetical protein
MRHVSGLGEAEMKDWIPFFVAIVWPVTIGIILVVFRKCIESILRSLDERIRNGAAFKTPFFSVDAEVNTESLSVSRPNGSGDVSSSGDYADEKGVELAEAVLRGVRLEIRLNEEVAESVLGDLDNLLRGTGLIPLRRLNEKATAGFIQRPLVPLDDRRINLSWVYLQEITMFNRLVNSIDNPTAPDGYTRARVSQALTFRNRLKKSGSELLAALDAKPSSPTQ